MQFESKLNARDPLWEVVTILEEAKAQLRDRAASRDTGGGAERSMARTVAIFNAAEGTNLTEHQGWVFMECLKMARRKSASLNGRVNRDDYVDHAAYTALAFECAASSDVVGQARPGIQSDRTTLSPEEALKAALEDANSQSVVRVVGAL